MSAHGDDELLAKASQAQSLLFFTPRFVLATLIGGFLAMSVLRGLKYSTHFMNLKKLYALESLKEDGLQ